jgi:predicted dehydrogenase
VKWYRSAEYYSRPVKGSWAGEGGGALINQAIHQVDLLLHLVGPVDEVFGYWQLGALHKIESEDCLCSLLHYSSGATGVIQASTALWPGYPERLEIHGTKGSAIVVGDQLTTWNVQGDYGATAPVSPRSCIWRIGSDCDLHHPFCFSTSERRARLGGPRPIPVEMDFVFSRLSVVSTRRVLKGQSLLRTDRLLVHI